MPMSIVDDVYLMNVAQYYCDILLIKCLRLNFDVTIFLKTVCERSGINEVIM